MRILYLNVHDTDYPRNREIRRFLERSGDQVDVVHRHDSELFLASAAVLLIRGILRWRRYDIVILSELGVQYAIFARAVAIRYRARLVVDRFVGMYETNVGDWSETSEESMRSKAYKMADRLSSTMSSLVLIDTEVRATDLADRGEGPVLSVPVGAPRWAIPRASPATHRSRLRLLFYGNYSPLHGVDYLLAGIASSRDLISEVLLVGDGALRGRFETMADELELSDLVTFAGAVPEPQLAQLIAGCDVVLGIFGDSPKARGVIANKVWQGLASGKYVLTRESDALGEIREIVGNSLIEVDTAAGNNFRVAVKEVLERLNSGRLPEESVDIHLNGYFVDGLKSLRNSLTVLTSRTSPLPQNVHR